MGTILIIMKLSHENLTLIENWLIFSNQEPSLDDDFVRAVYEDVLEHRYKLKSAKEKTKKRAYALQYDFVRRDLLKIIYRRNNFSASGIAAGFVYAIGNPA